MSKTILQGTVKGTRRREEEEDRERDGKDNIRFGRTGLWRICQSS